MSEDMLRMHSYSLFIGYCFFCCRFDGGFTPTLAQNVTALLARLQPHAVGFNAGGVGVLAG